MTEISGIDRWPGLLSSFTAPEGLKSTLILYSNNSPGHLSVPEISVIVDVRYISYVDF